MSSHLQIDAATRDPDRVRELFNGIAPRYDVANHLLSAGLDYLWRRRAANIVDAWNPKRVLDVATGTGDLALVLQTQLPESEVTGCDFSSGMLELATQKGLRKTAIADATSLPFPDASFDAVTIAFGLRNVNDRSTALKEFSRVLKDDGHLLVLDFSMPRPWLRASYRWYLHHLLPHIAGFISGSREAYRYLGESIEVFPNGKAMCQLIAENGFNNVVDLMLQAGIVTIYTAAKAGRINSTAATVPVTRPGM